MSKLMLHDYLCQNRIPCKIICIDSKTTYHRIPLYLAYLPVCASMIVDHVEIVPGCLSNDVVFVRVPDGLKV